MNVQLRLVALVGLNLIGAGCAAAGSPANTAKGESERDKPQKCLGAGMDRKVCFEIASRSCYAGFDIFDQDVAGDDGVVRNGLYFKCKP